MYPIIQRYYRATAMGRPTYFMEYSGIKLYMEFNIATWLRAVNYTELNISKLLYLNCDHTVYSCKTCIEIIKKKRDFNCEYAISKIPKFKFP